MSTIIKANRVAHLTDARYFAAKEVDFLGFNLEEGTEGYLDPMYMKAIREWVEGPKIVGEFSRSPMAVVREAASFFGLDAVQVSATRYGTELADLERLEVLVHLVSGPEGLPFSMEALRLMAAQSDYFIIEIPGANASKSLFYENKPYWQEVFSLRPALLQADLAPEDWPGLLADFGIAGLSLTGGEEEQVGVKSFDALEDIFEALEL